MITNDSGLDGVFTLEDGGGLEMQAEEFHVLFVGDWRGDGVREPISLRREVSIDRDNFDEVLNRFGPRVTVSIGDASVEIGFRSLGEFHPDSLFQRLPVFGELRELRGQLQTRDGYERAAGRVRSWFAESEGVQVATPAEDVAGGSLLDEILGASGASSTGSPLDDFISTIVSGHRVGIDEDERRSLTAVVDNAITAIMRGIIHSPGFKALEAAWRGLWLAVRRFETDLKHRFFIVDMTIAEIAGELRDATEIRETALAKLLAGEREYGALSVNGSFRMNVDDVAALIRISGLAQAVGVTAFTHVTADEFGLREWTAAGRVSFDEATVEGRLWNAVRAASGARSLAASIFRLLGRLPYGSLSDPTEEFGFEEFDGAPARDDCVWINPCFPLVLIRALAARDGSVEREFTRLPLFSFAVDGDTVAIPCAEFVLLEQSVGVLTANGLIPIIGFRDEDRVVVGEFRMVGDVPS